MLTNEKISGFIYEGAHQFCTFKQYVSQCYMLNRSSRRVKEISSHELVHMQFKDRRCTEHSVKVSLKVCVWTAVVESN